MYRIYLNNDGFSRQKQYKLFFYIGMGPSGGQTPPGGMGPPGGLV